MTTALTPPPGYGHPERSDEDDEYEAAAFARQRYAARIGQVRRLYAGAYAAHVHTVLAADGPGTPALPQPFNRWLEANLPAVHADSYGNTTE